MTANDPKIPLMVRRIEQLDAHSLGIEWSDGRRDRWRLDHLRRHCPCAHCQDEWTGERLLDPESVGEALQCSLIENVGRYALSIRFDDGHTTGIYTFPYLRELSQGEW